MRSLVTCLCLLTALIAACAPVAAQAKYLIAEKIERKTEADEGGAQQWAEWAELDCPSCAGKGKSPCQTCARFVKDATICGECKRKEPEKEAFLATCRVCAGKGKIADPLDEAPCAGCLGAGILLCTTCGGGGRLKVGGAARWSDCPSCRGEGGFECGGCAGKRVMSSIDVKPSLREADADKLKKAMEDIDKTLAAFEKFTPAGGQKARKAVKALGAAYGAGKKLHPAFKALPKSTKDYMGKIFAGSNFQGSGESEANTFAMLKSNAEYYLKHQRRMVELALKRAEANAALAGKK